MARDLDSLAEAYDYIVVGAGSAGCIVAAELAETGAGVLLIEAGPGDETLDVSDPRRDFAVVDTPLVHQYRSEPADALDGRELPIGQGRVLGGGGSVNKMFWTRGFSTDFDDWTMAGCSGWGFADVLPFFKRLEDWEGGDDEYRATGGPIRVRRPPAPHLVSQAWISAAVDLGLDHLDDVNAPMRAGVGYANLNVGRDGRRCSSARAYLAPQRARDNLKLALRTTVARLLFDGGRCVGCRLVRNGSFRDIRVTREVIVASGGIGSPHLLLRSGIGNADELRRLGIDPVAHLPGVGANYQDHALVPCVVLRARERLPATDAVSNHTEVVSFLYSGEGDGRAPDLIGVVMDHPVFPAGLPKFSGSAPDRAGGFTLAFGVTRPSSRGSVALASADWREPPRLDNGLLRTDLDRRVALRGVEHLRELAQQRAFRDISNGRVVPGGRADPLALVRRTATTFHHPAGTCRMGIDDEAVVDPQMRVRGVRGLRVCDSSIMPTIPGCPTNAASCMIGLRAAAAIAGR